LCLTIVKPQRKREIQYTYNEVLYPVVKVANKHNGQIFTTLMISTHATATVKILSTFPLPHITQSLSEDKIKKNSTKYITDICIDLGPLRGSSSPVDLWAGKGETWAVSVSSQRL